jgi:hypothetical protein
VPELNRESLSEVGPKKNMQEPSVRDAHGSGTPPVANVEESKAAAIDGGSATRLIVTCATYGVSTGTGRDVTAILRKAIAERTSPTFSIHELAPADFGDDPCPGVPKQLAIAYIDASGVARNTVVHEFCTKWRADWTFCDGASPRRKKVIQIYHTSAERVRVHSYHGFGDYLKGCACLYQLSRQQEFDLELDFSRHAIALYLAPAEATPAEATTTPEETAEVPTTAAPGDACLRKENVVGQDAKGGPCYSTEYSAPRDLNELLQLIRKCSPGGVCKLFTQADPVLPLDAACRDFIKSRCLSVRADTPLADKLAAYRALRPYSVVHVRTGDSVLVDKGSVIGAQHVAKTLSHQTFGTHNVIVMSDAQDMPRELKATLEAEHPDAKFYVTGARAVHLGMPSTTPEQTAETLLDFFILSESAAIYQVSVYGWGSGFSSWCSQLYGIPLHAFKLA